MIDIETLNRFGKEIVFLPDATRGAVRSLTNTQLAATGTTSIVANTLHLLISPGPEHIAELGGLHRFMNWDNGIILTDSGGYQVFSLLHSKKWQGKITNDGATFKAPLTGRKYQLTPESSIDIQMQLGSDILVVLDDCANSMTEHKDVARAVERTIRWAQRSKDHFENVYGGRAKTGKLLTCVIQGAVFRDLREKCAQALMEIGFDGYNLGSGWYDENGVLMYDELGYVCQMTPKDKFNYAMGVGKPWDVFYCARQGYTVFDTVLPTRNARHGFLFSTDRYDDNSILRLKNSQYSKDTAPIDSRCDCEACQNHSRAYVHQMQKVGEFTGYTLATIHNLRFYQKMVEVMNQHRSDLKDMEYRDLVMLMREK